MPEEEKPPLTSSALPADLLARIEESIAWSKKVVEGQTRIQRYLFWAVIGNFFRLAIIVVPIVLAILYLPPLLKDFSQQFLGASKNQNPYAEMLDLLKS